MATGLSDLYRMASLKWQRGDHNFMVYSLASVPTGIYDPARLAGVGIGHWAIHGGLGYTFLASSCFEASLTAGLTYNFVNPQTGYQSGLDGHVDAATSWSFGDALYLDVAGYLYNQLNADSGGNVRLGEFRSLALLCDGHWSMPCAMRIRRVSASARTTTPRRESYACS